MENIGNFEQGKDFYQQRESFIIENYPIQKSALEMNDLLGQGLDGFEVLEKRDSNYDLEGLISYSFERDNKNEKYCRLGIMLTREESRGEGVVKELFLKLEKIAQKQECEYFTASADTQEGEATLLSLGFYSDFDNIKKRDYYRFDL